MKNKLIAVSIFLAFGSWASADVTIPGHISCSVSYLETQRCPDRAPCAPSIPVTQDLGVVTLDAAGNASLSGSLVAQSRTLNLYASAMSGDFMAYIRDRKTGMISRATTSSLSSKRLVVEVEYTPDQIVIEQAKLECGLVTEFARPSRCRLPDCPAPPRDCTYDGAHAERDIRNCPLSCGPLVCRGEHP